MSCFIIIIIIIIIILPDRWWIWDIVGIQWFSQSHKACKYQSLDLNPDSLTQNLSSEYYLLLAFLLLLDSFGCVSYFPSDNLSISLTSKYRTWCLLCSSYPINNLWWVIFLVLLESSLYPFSEFPRRVAVICTFGLSTLHVVCHI